MSEAGIKRQVKRHWKRLQEEIASPFPLRGRVPWSMLHANKFGIQAAERLLRHTSPTITSKFYTDREAPVVPGIGAMLDAGMSKAF